MSRAHPATKKGQSQQDVCGGKRFKYKEMTFQAGIKEPVKKLLGRHQKDGGLKVSM